jgi:hypothetical protein
MRRRGLLQRVPQSAPADRQCAQKAKAFLWPSEFAALVSSEAVPLAWRRMFAITTYLPLLRAMHEETGGRGVVAPVRATDRKLSRQLRRCLVLAGVTRAELFVMGDPTRKAMRSTLSER